jgi:hypothetical protein
MIQRVCKSRVWRDLRLQANKMAFPSPDVERLLNMFWAGNHFYNLKIIVHLLLRLFLNTLGRRSPCAVQMDWQQMHVVETTRVAFLCRKSKHDSSTSLPIWRRHTSCLSYPGSVKTTLKFGIFHPHSIMMLSTHIWQDWSLTFPLGRGHA